MRKGAVIILLAAVGFMAWVLFSLLHFEPMKVVESRLSRTGDEVSVTGRIQNTGDEAAAIQIEIHYFDDGGRPIGTDKIDLNALKPGTSAEFHSPPRTLDHVANYSIYLNHGRNPYGN
jgi:hypothetical protein